MNIERTNAGSVTIALPKLDVPGYTYFVRRGDEIKIGSSGRPDQRIKQLRWYYPELTVLAVVSDKIADEYQTHQRFAHLRLHGEWFRPEPELLDFIAGLGAPAETQPSLKSMLPAIVGKMRKLHQGVRKERLSLLAAQIANDVPLKYIASQLALLGTC